MKNVFLHWVFPFLYAGACFGASPPSLDLNATKLLAQSRNPEILALERAVEEATLRRERTFAGYYPKIGIGTGADSEVATDGVGTQPLAFTYGQWNLFRGFSDQYQTKVADAQLNRARIKLDKAKFHVAMETEAAFNELVFSRVSLALRQGALKANENHKRLARNRRSSGLVSESDMLEYELRESLLQSDIAQLEQDIHQSELKLRQLIAANDSPQFIVPQRLDHWHVMGSLSDHISLAEKENEAVLLARQDWAESQAERGLTQAKWYPELDFEFSAGKIPYGVRFESNQVAFRGTLLLKMELFSGFDTSLGAREAVYRRQKLESAVQSAELEARASTERAWRKIKSTERRVHLEGENGSRAQRYYDSVLVEYKRGARNSTDVKAAAEILLDANLRQENYKYLFLTQKLDLERAVGVAVRLQKKPEKVERLEEDH